MKKNSFDVIVAGGGPGGIMAATYAAARGNKSVCFIDRKKHIGLPVRCGEGIGLKGVEKNCSVKPEWSFITI